MSTRALAPRTALILAAVMNMVGAFLGAEVASTVGSGIIDAPQGISGPASAVLHDGVRVRGADPPMTGLSAALAFWAIHPLVG